MKLSELIKQLQEIEREHRDFKIDIAVVNKILVVKKVTEYKTGDNYPYLVSTVTEPVKKICID